MKRTKTQHWVETDRREVGVVTGESKAGATFTFLYLVTERRKERGRVVEWRERVLHGATLYQAQQVTVSTAAMLEIVAKGVKALSHIARTEDELATSRRKAR